MDQYEHIRTANRVYGHCVSKIARDTGHSRNTIRKALRVELQGYKLRQSQSFPVLGPFSQMIEQWLVDDKEQPKKQRHSAAGPRSHILAGANPVPEGRPATG